MRNTSRNLSSLSLFALICTLLLSTDNYAQRHAPKQIEKPLAPTGSISGRVTSSGAPVGGVIVMLFGGDESVFFGKFSHRTRADSNGMYRFDKLAAGKYRVAPSAPAYIIANASSNPFESGKAVMIDGSEAIDNVDFTLERGGVITGRITDANGQPIIGENVNLVKLDAEGKPAADRSGLYSPGSSSTDDRGVYRIYGINAGRYLVSAGNSGNQQSFSIGGRNYAQTFYPDTREQSRATVVEVIAGDETAGIDIALKQIDKSYAATGRIVDADTGQPIANMGYGQGILSPDGKSVFGAGYTGARSNRRGEFRLDNLLPGNYAVIMSADNSNESGYADPVRFTIVDEDVSDLEMKYSRGVPVSGIVALEDQTNKEALAKSAQLELTYIFADQENSFFLRSDPAKINAGGVFNFRGVRPGKIRFSVADYRSPHGFSIARIERNGTPLADIMLDVKSGEPVMNLRVVLAYGAGKIRGTINVVGGELPPNAILRVFARRLNNVGVGDDWRSVEADVNRRFSFENLSAGEYEIVVNALGVFPPSSQGAQPKVPRARQQISISGAGETQIALTIDLTPQPDKD